MPLQLMLPMPEAEFVRRAVAPSAESDRWRAAWTHVRERLSLAPLLLPEAGATRSNAATAGCSTPHSDSGLRACA